MSFAVEGMNKSRGQDMNDRPVNSSKNTRVNKYKRSKNLVKKCADVAKQFDFDIILVIMDKKSKRCREFHTNPHMSYHDLAQEIKKNDTELNYKYEKICTEHGYTMQE